MKKLFVFTLILVLLFSFSTSAYASDNIDAEEPFVEELTVRFDNSPIDTIVLNNMESPQNIKKMNYFSQASQQISNHKFSIDASSLSSILDNVITSDENLVALSMKNVYCEEVTIDGEFQSRLMTKSEVESFQSDVTSVSSLIEQDHRSRGRLTFVVAVSTTEIAGRELAYLVSTTSTWSAMGSDGSIYPAPGPDSVCIAWGGQFYRESEYASLTSFSGNSIPTQIVGYTPNAGYGWEFEDAPNTAPSSSNLERGVCRVTLTKNQAVGELTEISATYIHTYRDIDWNFSVGAGFDGSLSGSVSITPSYEDYYWQVPINITNITY